MSVWITCEGKQTGNPIYVCRERANGFLSPPPLLNADFSLCLCLSRWSAASPCRTQPSSACPTATAFTLRRHHRPPYWLRPWAPTPPASPLPRLPRRPTSATPPIRCSASSRMWSTTSSSAGRSPTGSPSAPDPPTGSRPAPNPEASPSWLGNWPLGALTLTPMRPCPPPLPAAGPRPPTSSMVCLNVYAWVSILPCPWISQLFSLIYPIIRRCPFYFWLHRLTLRFDFFMPFCLLWV